MCAAVLLAWLGPAIAWAGGQESASAEDTAAVAATSAFTCAHVCRLAGGLALFLYGMTLASDNLKDVADILRRLANTG